MVFRKPRLIIAALRGGAGKTLMSIGLLAAWRQYHGLKLVPFKKGPDYIDSGWLSMAAGTPCYNLDPFLMTGEAMLTSFMKRSSRGDGSIIEGNRGLYDGVDIRGSYSTAELAKLLQTPVVLVVDATKVTRTAAAQVLGCLHFDPEVKIAAVLLNQVAGGRHERILRGAIEQYCGIPVLGVLPRQNGNLFPERHLGLVPPQESKNVADSLRKVALSIQENVDLPLLWDLARSADPLAWPIHRHDERIRPAGSGPVTIGVVRDSAFQFYYPENLEALRDHGASLVEISSFEERPLPTLDALYIGGGFPETHLELLSNNAVFRQSIKDEIERGLPVYAECGGLMFLSEGILHGHSRYPMVGAFPFDVDMGRSPQGHGYTIMECVRENPFFSTGTVVKGHEFHYSRVTAKGLEHSCIFRLQKGHGIVAGWDGICYRNTLACYSHIHAVGCEDWPRAMVQAARRYQQERSERSLDCQVDAKQGILGDMKFSTRL